jgi:hypothetical protein
VRHRHLSTEPSREHTIRSFWLQMKRSMSQH